MSVIKQVQIWEAIVMKLSADKALYKKKLEAAKNHGQPTGDLANTVANHSDALYRAQYQLELAQEREQTVQV